MAKFEAILDHADLLVHYRGKSFVPDDKIGRCHFGMDVNLCVHDTLCFVIVEWIPLKQSGQLCGTTASHYEN